MKIELYAKIRLTALSFVNTSTVPVGVNQDQAIHDLMVNELVSEFYVEESGIYHTNAQIICMVGISWLIIQH